jgi:anhydro-N-acetylmuramic acid kinase
LAAGSCDLVVSHGQTIYHWVSRNQAHGTLQLGQPAWIAAQTGCSVIADLRARDVAHGGHGAPLASTLDVLLLGRDDIHRRAALNLGGISNITIVGGSGTPLAFDIGPANALLDVAIQELTQGLEIFDEDGRRAAAGQVDVGLLTALLDDPYYKLDPPKSTGKEHFHLFYLREHLGDRPFDNSVLATLVELTAETVARVCRDFGVVEVIASGGGVANVTLMNALRERLTDLRAELSTIDSFGIPSGAKEAYLFALLGFLSMNGLPGAVPPCTGSRQGSILGSLVPGARGWPDLPRAFQTPTRLIVEAG